MLGPLLALWPATALSFCGFYVASGDAKLFNRASQVVLVRDGDRTVMTMMNDYQGDPKQFAVVIPVPTVLQKGQIHIGDTALVARLDAFTAPRLVEYFDENPCAVAVAQEMAAKSATRAFRGGRGGEVSFARDGVTIEARYTVGEYDILILSAKESDGLEIWLHRNGYRVPAGASRVLGGYMQQGMKFFVAKVNLEEQKRLGFAKLRPIQVAYESPKFMLPIRLGMVNAKGTQDILLYTLTRNGRVEAVNYRTVKLPSDKEVPEFVKERFGDFYRDLFAEQVRRNDMSVVFTEYAWDVSWCDPCPTTPLTNNELKLLGVFWLDGSANRGWKSSTESNRVFVTRLHARYDREHFPQDLVLQETGDLTNFQGRFVIRHPWTGTDECPALAGYRERLRERRASEARTLADLTGWSMAKIRAQMAVNEDWSAPGENLKWWERIWPSEGK